MFFTHPRREGFWLVKRVIGLPGEEVRIVDGRVVIDGSDREDLWAGASTVPEGEWKVPPGHMFVLSDARHRTLADSRTLGPVPIADAYVSRFRYRRGRR